MTRCVRAWSLKSLQALQKAFALQDVHQSSVPGTGEDHGDVFDSEHKARANDQNILLA
jgi:hypothetical protein